MVDRASSIIEEARSWIGTPYRHQCSIKGIGCDCLGLILGVHRNLTGVDLSEEIPNYTRSWNDHRTDDPLVRLTEEYLPRVPREVYAPGDVAIFRMKRRRAAKHCAVMADGSIIHSFSNHSVREDPLTDYWKQRVAAVFRL